MSETLEAPPTWAIVSLMGHKTYAGRLSEEERFGCKMGRIDIPEENNCGRCGGASPTDPGHQCPACENGTVTIWRTVYFGGASVYSIQVVTEAVARVAARGANPTPVSPWDFPKQLAAMSGVIPTVGGPTKTPFHWRNKP